MGPGVQVNMISSRCRSPDLTLFFMAEESPSRRRHSSCNTRSSVSSQEAESDETVPLQANVTITPFYEDLGPQPVEW